MTEPLDVVRGALSRLGLPFKDTARGIRSCCPVHETKDSDPSCDFDRGNDGRVLVTCRSGGCSFESIVEALGLQPRDLRGDAALSIPARPRATSDEAPKKLGTLADACMALGHGRSCTPFVYKDENGRAVFAVVRVDLGNGEKRCPQIHADEGGAWWLGLGPLKGRSLPLFNLPELVASAKTDDLVLVVEGEKCARAAAPLGFVATTTSGGAGKARLSDLSPLRGRRVAVLPDADRKGRDHAEDVARLALEAGAREVRVVELDGLGESEDLVEWIGHRESQSSGEIACELTDMIEATAPRERQRTAEPAPSSSAALPPSPMFRTVSLAELVQRPPVPWLVENLVPAQGVTLFAGAPKTGKSMVLIDLMLGIAHGRTRWLGRTIRTTTEPSGVLYLLLEGQSGSPARVRGWQAAHPAERLVGRFEVLDDFDLPGALLGEAGAPLTEAWLARLAAEWQAAGTPLRLVVLDTLAQSSDGAENKTEEMAPVMRALARVAARLKVAVVLVHHIRKGAVSDGRWRELVLDDVRGTTGIVGAVDAILGLQRDRTGERLMLSNLGSRDGAGFAPVGMELRPVLTGILREDGAPETSAYVVESELPSPQGDDPAKQAAKDAENRDRLLRAAEGLLDLSSAKELCKAAGIRPENQRLVAAMATGADAVLVAVPYAAGRYRYGTPATVERWQQAKQGAKGNHAEPKGQESSEHGSEGSHGSMVPAPRTPLWVGNPRGDGVQESGPQDRNPLGNHAEPCGTMEPKTEDDGQDERPKRRRRRRAEQAEVAGGEA
jgi:hypothetical protein